MGLMAASCEGDQTKMTESRAVLRYTNMLNGVFEVGDTSCYDHDVGSFA